MERTNSIGMRLVAIPAGSFHMGQRDGELDEQPVHEVRITRPYFMATTPVTNAQWEQFKPEAKHARGEWGVSEHDDSAVICVNWHDAMTFCDWLSAKEGIPYRLPTEAEWEHACRAGTTAAYWTGDVLPEQHRHDNPDARAKGGGMVDDGKDPLLVARSPANPWGLHDMHGLVEEWCLDWHGPYEHPPTAPSPVHQTFKDTVENPDPDRPTDGFMGAPLGSVDPLGRVPGLAGAWKVTRGGSYEALVKHLRSAARMAQHPTSRSRFIGLRVVQAPAPGGTPLPLPPPPGHARNVRQAAWQWDDRGRSSTPIWEQPKPLINPPPTAPNAREFGLFPHNHCPAITWCDNGDLLAIWFSCVGEHDRDSFVILASRLVPGATAWEPPSMFFKCAGRNMTGSALFNDGKGRLLHFNGIDESSSWSSLIMTVRESRDNGATWSEPRNIGGPHGYRNQVIACTRSLPGGGIVQLCDAVPGASGGSAAWISTDGGLTWRDPGAGKPWPSFKAGNTGAWIAGIHASVEVIEDGKALLAFGRDDNIEGRAPQSISRDGGETWKYAPSSFPPVSWGQRFVLMRLEHSPGKPLAFFSYTNPRRSGDEHQPGDGIVVVDARGKTKRVFGLFSALSFDEGKTWTHHRLVSDGSGSRHPCMDYRVDFVMNDIRAEPSGYNAACQSPDGMIHLISSSNHYCFNLAWLMTPSP